jgi:alcohol dehydrogenase
MLASMKAGLAFSNAILGAVHAMSHSLGGYLDLAHGECNAILLEHVVDFNFDFARNRYVDIAEIMGIKTKGLHDSDIKSRLIFDIMDLKRRVGIKEQLYQKGVRETDLPNLAKKAVKDACMITNPRKASEDDVIAIFRESM